MKNNLRWVIFLVAAVLGFILDVGTKEMAFEHSQVLHKGGRIEVIPGWFDFALSENRGAAWGLFWGQSTFFALVSIAAFLAITYFVHTAPKDARRGPLILGLVMAGVAGNFWDRQLYGAVRDFIDWHVPEAGTAHDIVVKVFGRTHWPTFNVADIFICVGAGALVFLMWKEGDQKTTPAPHPKKEEAKAP